MDRRSKYVSVSERDFDEYRKAYGKRKVELHLLLFYVPYQMPPTGTAMRLEHPILAGELQ